MIRSIGIALLLALAHPAVAQVNAQFADFNDEIELLRSLARMERKAIVEAAMALTPVESQAFWSVYNEYEREKALIDDRTVKVITDYAAAYPDVGDVRAKQLMDDAFKVEADVVSLKKKYARRFEKALSPARVARFFQIERKLDAAQNLTFAEEIPLIEQ